VHRGRLMDKMQAKSLADLISIAQKLGVTGKS
jgi:FixJ family two-component response regulator